MPCPTSPRVDSASDFSNLPTPSETTVAALIRFHVFSGVPLLSDVRSNRAHERMFARDSDDSGDEHDEATLAADVVGLLGTGARSRGARLRLLSRQQAPRRP